jgi:hypothetical protein
VLVSILLLVNVIVLVCVQTTASNLVFRYRLHICYVLEDFYMRV